MKWLVDHQLPVALARALEARGQACRHVQDLGLEASSDESIWQVARAEGCVIVSKDDDFQALANRRGTPPQIVWVRIGNCRKSRLLDLFDRLLPDMKRELESGTAVVEIR